jgi:hypothetical protein
MHACIGKRSIPLDSPELGHKLLFIAQTDTAVRIRKVHMTPTSDRRSGIPSGAFSGFSLNRKKITPCHTMSHFRQRFRPLKRWH